MGIRAITLRDRLRNLRLNLGVEHNSLGRRVLSYSNLRYRGPFLQTAIASEPLLTLAG
jgi:hypothetical protein